MYLVIGQETPWPFSYLQYRFEPNIQLNILITTNIKYLSFADNYGCDI
jgi:hypothetical protein